MNNLWTQLNINWEVLPKILQAMLLIFVKAVRFAQVYTKYHDKSHDDVKQYLLALVQSAFDFNRKKGPKAKASQEERFIKESKRLKRVKLSDEDCAMIAHTFNIEVIKDIDCQEQSSPHCYTKGRQVNAWHHLDNPEVYRLRELNMTLPGHRFKAVPLGYLENESFTCYECHHNSEEA